MLDNVIRDVRGRRVPSTQRRTVTRSQLDSMNIPQKEKDKLIRQGLVSEKYTQQQKDAKTYAQYKDVTNPKRPVDPISALKLKKA